MDAQQKKVVTVVAKINEKQKPCKKTMQKMVYLLQEAGVDMDFDYGIHYYGPYSSDLDYTIQDMAFDGFLKIEQKGLAHNILLGRKHVELEDELYTRAEKERMSSIIESYGVKSASELELLATTLYVGKQIKGKKDKGIIQGVEKLKGSKYSQDEISSAIDSLRDNGYFN